MDFTSSEDEFEEDFDFEYRERQKRNFMNQTANAVLTEAEKKEQQIKSFYMYLMTGKVEEVLKEIEKGIDVNQKFQDEWTPILIASSTGNYDLLKLLHEKGADVKLTKGGQTALILAANCPEATSPFEQSSKAVKFLLDLGVDPNARNRSKVNALMCAANNGNLEAMKLLLPVTDLKAVDNQNWSALFWAVNCGNLEAIAYLLENGLPHDTVDIRDNSILDLARYNGHDEVLEIFALAEEAEEDYSILQNYTDFESIFKDLKKGQRPQFFNDVCKILHGARSEYLIKLFSEKNVTLFDFLTHSEDDFENLGVQMPFQRRRLIAALHRFHKHPFYPRSIPTVGKNEIYSTMDVAAAILSAVKQITIMNATLRFLSAKDDSRQLILEDVEIQQSLVRIEKQLKSFKSIVRKLHEKAINWDSDIQPVNLITDKSGKRWFPWRKTIFTLGIVIVISLISHKPFSLKK